ncbi:MAG: hypothetical protein ACOC1K_05385 [Nanoarchaeota archaeon]
MSKYRWKYNCAICGKTHYTDSKIGKKHFLKQNVYYDDLKKKGKKNADDTIKNISIEYNVIKDKNNDNIKKTYFKTANYCANCGKKVDNKTSCKIETTKIYDYKKYQFNENIINRFCNETCMESYEDKQISYLKKIIIYLSNQIYDFMKNIGKK